MERPYVHINCACTADGKIANSDGSRLRISSDTDMERVHRLRAQIGALLVGAGTVIADEPKLTVKERYVDEPPVLKKVVLDGKGRIPLSSRLLRTPGPTIILLSDSADPSWREGIEKTIEAENLDVNMIEVDGEEGRIPLDRALSVLKENGIEKIMVEGGSGIIREFVSSGLFDRFTLFVGSMLVGGSGPSVVGVPGLPEGPVHLILKEIRAMGRDGVLLDYDPVR